MNIKAVIIWTKVSLSVHYSMLTFDHSLSNLSISTLFDEALAFLSNISFKLGSFSGLGEWEIYF